MTSQGARYRTGGFHCFSCKVGGDGIKYVRDIEERTFAEALEVFGLTMALVDTDEGVHRAAQCAAPAGTRARSREVEGLHPSETMQASLDLVELRNGLLHKSHRMDWRRHGILPAYLRVTPAVRRQEQRLAEYKKMVLEEKRKQWRRT